MQKGFAHLLLIAIILAAIVAAASTYFFIFKNPQSDKDILISPNDRMVPPIALTEEAMRKNQTYRNQSLGFEFVVPKDYFVKEETEAEFHKRSNGEMRKNFTYYIKYPPAEFNTSLYVLNKENDYENAPLSLWVFENPDNLNPEEFYKEYWYYPFIWGDYSSAKEKIAPTEVFRIAEASGSSGIATFKTNSPRFIYLPKNGKMYLFKVIDSKILDSFKFSD
jgi:hypothetical protein